MSTPPVATSQNMLPIGTRIGEFEITALIGEGGFGIVYLAFDHSLERQVALKEYMPATLAMRKRSAMVNVRSERDQYTFQAGLKSFLNEARLLAQFDHRALVKVHRFWEGNGTAYMVMPYYEGITFKDALRKMGRPPGEEWLRKLLGPLLDALAFIHERQCFHRDIAPDNILILREGGPVLLDFGAARKVISDMAQALTVILKPGYAPVEQYADVPGMRQGAWTDIYALAAVIYFAVTGRTPMPSVARLVSDGMAPLSHLARDRYSAAFLAGIDRALSVKPEDRPQKIAEFRAAIGMGDGINLIQTIPPDFVSPAQPSPPPMLPIEPLHTPEYKPVHGAMPAPAQAISGNAFDETIPQAVLARDLAAGRRVIQERPYPLFTPAPSMATSPERAAAPSSEVATAARGPQRTILIAAGAVIVLLLLAIAAYLLWGGGKSLSPADQAGTISAAPIAAPIAAPAAAQAPASATTVAPAASTPATTPSSSPPSTSLPDTPSQAAPPLSTFRPELTPSPLLPKSSVHHSDAPPPHPHATAAASAPDRSPEASPRIQANPAQCADLLQRASLGETLTPDEKALLKRSCR